MPLTPAFPGLPIPGKKYPAFLTADDYQMFSALEILSQKIWTRFGKLQGIMTSWQSTGKATSHKTAINCSYSPFDAV
jgi:hypothetical protein